MPGTWEPKHYLDVLRDVLDRSRTLPYTSGVHFVVEEDLGLYYHAQTSGDELRFLDFREPTDAQVEALAKACEPASFGRGTEDVLDENYRKAGKMDVSRFACRLDIGATGILDAVTPYLLEGREDVVEDEEMGLAAEMYKLNVYGPGSFFKEHKDTPRGEDMVGSLVIVLPTKHTGGALTLKHDGADGRFDSASELAAHTSSSPAVAYVAFYSDVVHAVEPVTEGYRVTLTYNLYLRNRPRSGLTEGNRLLPPPESAFETALRALVADGRFMTDGGVLGFGLSHQYPVPRPQNRGNGEARTRQDAELFAPLHILKGNDARIRSGAARVGLETLVRLVYETPPLTWRGQDTLHVAASREMDLEWLETEFHNLRNVMRKQGQVLEKQDEEGNIIRAPKNGDGDGDEDEGDEEEDDMEDGTDEIDAANAGVRITVYWVTPQTSWNQVDSRYIATGNQATIEHTYGDAVLFVKVPAVGEPGREDVVAPEPEEEDEEDAQEEDDQDDQPKKKKFKSG
uniref:Fe2OG dioxygenase domain-containing protein n=1 Tax=Mycena chlorophos TaxID=658473 RepID=A0ABQ0MAR5_MYCCL|nr:predicted protein [Mycena chlorophos]